MITLPYSLTDTLVITTGAESMAIPFRHWPLAMPDEALQIAPCTIHESGDGPWARDFLVTYSQKDQKPPQLLDISRENEASYAFGCQTNTCRRQGRKIQKFLAKLPPGPGTNAFR